MAPTVVPHEPAPMTATLLLTTDVTLDVDPPWAFFSTPVDCVALPVHPAAAHLGGDVAVLVPMKAFAQAKVRLAPALTADARVRLVQAMAEQVLRAAGPLPTAVVCDDDEVAAWAHGHGASVLWTPGLGLNGAVEEGVRSLWSRGARRVIVSHADLPLAAGLPALALRPGISLVPDRHRDGTNVVCIPSGIGFRFSYGPGSFARHAAEARRHPVPLHVLREPHLAWDVDVPDDLLFSQIDQGAGPSQAGG